MPLGAKQEGRDRVQAERQDMRHMPLSVSLCRKFGGFWAKSILVNSNQKEKFLVSSAEVLSKEVLQGKALGGRGDC